MTDLPTVSHDHGTFIIFGEKEAKRLVKILQQIAENLERKHIIDVKRILTDIVRNSEKGDQTDFEENVNKFVEIVIFKAGISVNLLKQAVRGFIMIKRQPRFGELVSKLVSQLLAEEFPSLARMGEIDDETLRIYIKALEEGVEKARHVRLMIVGMFGVGKTCLARKLCNEEINDVKSTTGIDVALNVCEVDKNGNWFIKEENSRDDQDYDKRLDKVMRQASSSSLEESGKQEPLSNSAPVVPATSLSQTSQSYSRSMDLKIQTAQKKFEDFKEIERPGIEDYKAIINDFKKIDTKEVTTEEIKQRPGRNITVSIWDFAGQSVYYSTHHFFLSSRSIYLLVLDISKPLDTKVQELNNDDEEEDILLKGCMPEGFTCGDAFRFWINSIYTYARDGHTYHDFRKIKPVEYEPTIVLIGTHKDKLEGTEKKKEILKDEYFRDALEPLRENPALYFIHREKFLVSCTEDLPEVFIRIRKSIIGIAKEQSFWKEPIPAKWIPLERTLQEEKSKEDKKKNFMDLKDLETKNSENEYPLQNLEQIRLFLQFQHFFGNIIYYNVENLNQVIILRPQWILDMFKLFVTHQPSFKEKEVEAWWSDYKKKAILKPALFNQLISGSKHIHKIGTKETIAKLVKNMMEHLDVMARPVTLQVKEQILEKEDFFIVPSMLKKLVLDKDQKDILLQFFQPSSDFGKHTSVLCFVFRNGFLPPAIFHRLLATCIRKWEIVKNNKDFLLYNGLGVFKLDNQWTLTLWYAEYIIYLRISSFTANTYMNTKRCVKVKEDIYNMLRQILLLDKQKKSLIDTATLSTDFEPFKEYILCEKSLFNSINVMFKDAHMSGLLEVEKFREHESLYCECGANHSVLRSDVLKYWYPEYVKEAAAKYFEDIRSEHGDLKGIPEAIQLGHISEFVGAEYKDLGKALGLTQQDLDRIEEDNPSNMSVRVFKVLELWQKSSPQPTFEVLQSGMMQVN